MKTRQIIEASADVLTIVTLKKGDVYKRVVEASTFESSRLQFGIVTSVMHNGEDGAIAAIEYGISYSGLDVQQIVMTTGSDIAIYPATVEEVREHLSQIRQTLDRKVKEATDAVEKATMLRADCEEVLSGLVVLSNPETSSVAVDADA